MNNDLIAYYSDRAKEYEKVYDKPERQSDLQKLKEILKEDLKGKNILEIACGTGHWTTILSETANKVCAIDKSEEVLKVAESKNYLKDNVEFKQADIYELPRPENLFDTAFGGFIWSHIPIEKLSQFISAIHKSVSDDGRIIFFDNTFVEGNSTPVFKTDNKGNTYQKRKLEDGSEHLVLKNYPTEKNIREVLKDKGKNVEFTTLNYYWILKYEKNWAYGFGKKSEA